MRGEIHSIDGIDTHVIDEGSGPTIVLLHGAALGVDTDLTWHRTIDALVDHFCNLGDGPELPVLWHQSLLVFAQRYKADVGLEQKERLKALFKAQFHHQITPEIRRELFSAASRGEAPAGAGTAMET